MIERSRLKSINMSLLLVAAQVLVSAAIVFATCLRVGNAIGLAVATAGMLFGVWAIIAIGIRRVSVLPELKPNAELVVSGPYRLVRHPMYTALLVFTAGLAFSPFAVWKGLAWFVLLRVLIRKSIIEERYLNQRFPDYEEYSRRTKRIIPFLL